MRTNRQRRKTILGQVLAMAFKVAQENHRLRTALEYYAAPANWREGVQGEFTLLPTSTKPTAIASEALGFRATYVARPPSRSRRCWAAVVRFVKEHW